MVDEKEKGNSLVSLDGSVFALVNVGIGDAVGAIASVANNFIAKIAGAFAAHNEPRRIVGLAKAEVEAGLIRKQGELQALEIQQTIDRTLGRFVSEEVKKQQNMESIAQQAIPLLKEESQPEKMDDDWITNFFEKSRTTSNAKMQELWASVLAREANEPGAFSRRTINLLSDLDKRDAELFTKLCGFCCTFGRSDGEQTALIFNTDHSAESIYTSNGISFAAIQQLEHAGLIAYEALSGFMKRLTSTATIANYFGDSYLLTPPDGTIQTGKVLLTNAGEELWRVCTPSPVPGFLNFLLEKWRAEKLNPIIAVITRIDGNSISYVTPRPETGTMVVTPQ